VRPRLVRGSETAAVRAQLRGDVGCMDRKLHNNATRTAWVKQSDVTGSSLVVKI
jgi:hypothetical protein